MAKQRKSSLKGLGARYGLKPRKKYTMIHRILKAKRKCPECGSTKFGRRAVGVWSCKKCGFKIAGMAYEVSI